MSQGETMSEIQFAIHFKDTNAAQAQIWASNLREHLLDIDRSVRVTQQRENDEHMDLGGILAIVLGSSAITAVAKGLEAWLTRNQTATLEISQNGEIKATGLRGKEAIALAELVMTQKALPPNGDQPKKLE